MAKWFGKIGYSNTNETDPGVWEKTIVEKEYYGDIISNKLYHKNSNSINDEINMSISLSIVADPFAYQHCSNIEYVEYMGTKWKVTDIDPSQRPRLTLTIGGVYNEQTS